MSRPTQVRCKCYECGGHGCTLFLYPNGNLTVGTSGRTHHFEFYPEDRQRIAAWLKRVK